MTGFCKYAWRGRARRDLSSVVSLLSIAMASCGGTRTVTSPTPPSQPPLVAAATIDATPSITFSPANIHLVQGGTVTFAFGAVGHNVFFDEDPAGAPANIPGVNVHTSVDRVFTTPGTYTFDCHIHPGMRGTVVVFAPDTL